MSAIALLPATVRRLIQLPRLPEVWEGDRCPLSRLPVQHDLATPKELSEAVIWADRRQPPFIRSMDPIPQDSGAEAMVQCLLRAMEDPQGPAAPGRPKKVVVRDRELQFFLRGALKGLDIEVDYAPQLPHLESLLEQLEELGQRTAPPALSAACQQRLGASLRQAWTAKLWSALADHEILQIDLNTCEVGSFYVSVMGAANLEFGFLLYRSLDSLREFRAAAESSHHLAHTGAAAFMRQDCLFVNYEVNYEPNQDEAADNTFNRHPLFGALQSLMGQTDDNVDFEDVETSIGVIHPLEGVRHTLDEQEATALAIALEALCQFWRKHHRVLTKGFPVLGNTFRLPGLATEAKKLISVRVKTLPELAAALLPEHDDDDNEDDNDAENEDAYGGAISLLSPTGEALRIPISPEGINSPQALQALLQAKAPHFLRQAALGSQTTQRNPSPKLNAHWVPDNAMLMIGGIDFLAVQRLRSRGVSLFYPPKSETELTLPPKNDGLPILAVQTSQPKAARMIAQLKEWGGPTGIGFVQAEDENEDAMELALIRTQSDHWVIFNEYFKDDKVHINSRQKWNGRVKATQQRCGLVIAKGGTGKSRGELSLSNIVRVYELPFIADAEMAAMGTLYRHRL